MTCNLFKRETSWSTVLRCSDSDIHNIVSISISEKLKKVCFSTPFSHLFVTGTRWREIFVSKVVELDKLYHFVEETFSSHFTSYAQYVCEKCMNKHTFFYVSLLDMHNYALLSTEQTFSFCYLIVKTFQNVGNFWKR